MKLFSNIDRVRAKYPPWSVCFREKMVLLLKKREDRWVDKDKHPIYQAPSKHY